MAKSLKKIIEEKNARLNDVPDEFLSQIEKFQKTLFPEIISIIDALDRKDGFIVASHSNINKIATIIEDLRSTLATSEFPTIVQSFVDEFASQKILSDAYFEKAFTDFSGSSFADAVLKKSQDDAIQAFLGSPIDKEFLLPIESLLTDAVGAAGSWKETVQNIQAFATGTDETDGKLLRYGKQIAHDRFAISDRSYGNAVNDELETEWYLYSGGEIETTRCFCRERHEKYFHWKEVMDWGEGKNLGECETDNGLWQGAFASTNGTNIFLYAGGANCRHNLLGVSVFSVPEEDIRRNIANGNYEPDKAEREALGLSDEDLRVDEDPKEKRKELKYDISVLQKDDEWQRMANGLLADKENTKMIAPELSHEEKIAIYGYSRNQYMGLNPYLRTGEIAPQLEGMFTKKYLDNYKAVLNNALDKIDTKYEGVVYRGARLSKTDAFKLYQDALKNDEVVEHKYYTSASTGKGNFPGGDTTFLIHSKNGKSIKSLSRHEGEEEVLFKSGTKFRVLRAEEKIVDLYGMKMKEWFIELEEL